MDIAVYVALLVVALIAISHAADLFVQAASVVGKRLGLADYLIGSFIVGIGTSLPELVTSVSAVLKQEPILVAPNVFGTVISNIYAGFGLSVGLLYLFVRDRKRMRIFTIQNAASEGSLDFAGTNVLATAMPVALFSVVASYFLCKDSEFSRFDAVLFAFCYVAFMVGELNKRKSPEFAIDPAEQPDDEAAARENEREQQSKLPVRDAVRPLFPRVLLAALLAAVLVWMLGSGGALTGSLLSMGALLLALFGVITLDFLLAQRGKKPVRIRDFGDFRETALEHVRSSAFLFVYIAVALALLFLSGDAIVVSVVYIAERVGLESTVLSASVIALGTSLPDIIVAIKVARRGRHEMLIGHIIQSNIFDVFLIMGICGLMTPLPIDADTLALTIPFAIGANVVLLAILQDNNISGTEGLMMLVGYVSFLGLLYGAL